jgi:hypothetical protein
MFTITKAGTHGLVVLDTGVVTLLNGSIMAVFNQKFIQAIAQHRHWARERIKEKVPA